MAQKNVVVVGAGVAGLTTALMLSKDSSYCITIAAKHMPGDYDIEYASPWAGANYMPVSMCSTPSQQWDEDTWATMDHLAKKVPEAGIRFQGLRILNRKKDAGSATANWFAGLLAENPWWKRLFPDYRAMTKAELGSNYDNGHALTSVCINTAIYLPWLLSQCLKSGIVFKRAVIEHINDASSLHHTGTKADMIINCTGLSSRKLGGVCDLTVHPARGQIVVVRNESKGMISVSGTDDGEDEAMYMMCRPAGGGTVLGGCYQKDNWESQPDPNLAIRIMKRCVEANPELTNGKGIEALDIIRHGVGLRPARDDGARIEKEKINGMWVVHNYGHGGAGYQCSYGCAKAAVKLVEEAFRDKAKL